jgi:surface protein
MNETIKEDRYQFIIALYMIRTQYRRMGLFQPDFIYVIFKSMMPSKYDRTDDDIKTAVAQWYYHISSTSPTASASLTRYHRPNKIEQKPDVVRRKYGDISKWNTSRVTIMKKLFHNKSQFNDDISKWDVGNVIDMDHMFCNTGFNCDISKWNVSKVINMSSMFSGCPFNGDISEWNVSNVINMSSMFSGCPFNGDISKWNVSNVVNMMSLFMNARFFDGNLSKWNINKVTNMYGIFMNSGFKGNVSMWTMSNKTTDTMNAFTGCSIPKHHKFHCLR